MNRYSSLLTEGNVAKALAALTVVWVLAVGNTTGAFAAFWRTVNLNGTTPITDGAGYGYGYGYDGATGYGYGYGYGYWYDAGSGSSGGTGDSGSSTNSGSTDTTGTNTNGSSSSSTSGGGGSYYQPISTQSSTGGTNVTVTKTKNGVTVTDGTKTVTFQKPPYVLKSLGEIKLFDVKDSWAKNYVYRLAARGIINNADAFNPEQGLTRAEFLKIAINAAGWKAQSGASVTFKDVGSDEWYASYVSLAVSKGLVSTKNENFRPNDPISRAEAAKILVSMFGVDVSKAKITFADLDPQSDLSKYAEMAKILNIFSGQTIGGKLMFRPSDSITRAEISKVVVKAFNL